MNTKLSPTQIFFFELDKKVYKRHNFVYAQKKSLAYTAPIFTKLTNFQ